jgi:hypothetical protein
MEILLDYAPTLVQVAEKGLSIGSYFYKTSQDFKQYVPSQKLGIPNPIPAVIANQKKHLCCCMIICIGHNDLLCRIWQNLAYFFSSTIHFLSGF